MGAIIGWLAFAILVLGFVYFAIHYPGFRRTLGYIGVGAVVLACAAFVLDQIQSEREEQRRRIAGSLIKPGEVEVSDARLSLGGYSSELTAVVTNKSRYFLRDITIKVTVTDCPAAPPPVPSPNTERKAPSMVTTTLLELERQEYQRFEALKREHAQRMQTCGIVGQDVVSTYGLNVPSGQKRGLRHTVVLGTYLP